MCRRVGNASARSMRNCRKGHLLKTNKVYEINWGVAFQPVELWCTKAIDIFVVRLNDAQLTNLHLAAMLKSIYGRWYGDWKIIRTHGNCVQHPLLRGRGVHRAQCTYIGNTVLFSLNVFAVQRKNERRNVFGKGNERSNEMKEEKIEITNDK